MTRHRPPATDAAASSEQGYYRGDTYRTEDSVGFLMKQAVELLSRATAVRPPAS